MVFSSAIFLWAFLPGVFLIDRILPKRLSNGFLLLASLLFYAWGEPFLVLVMMLSILINWAVGIGIKRLPTLAKGFLAAGVLVDLSLLGYYKYANFLVKILNTVLRREVIPVPGIALPIGISFFTFQAISYLADVYRGETEAQPSLINVALYISFFPQLIAGPIVKYRDIAKQLQERQVLSEDAGIGFRRFIYGLGKKVLIANTLGLCADRVFGADIEILGAGAAWIGVLAYTFQIYYDFSGYSDMAIGLGRMFGFRIPENFQYPYLSDSIAEFWRRWHISLGTWFREYVYIPLGGNRKGTKRTYLNLFIVFFLTGLWHGAGLNYIAWGLYHGGFSIGERLTKRKPGRILSFLIVMFGWVLFRANGLLNAARYLSRMLLFWRHAGSLALHEYADSKTLAAGILAVIGCGILVEVVPERVQKAFRDSRIEVLWCGLVLLLCLASVASDTYNPFIYFQF